MTAYSQISKGKERKTGNKKDGATGRRKKDNSAEFETLGFVPIDWNKWEYKKFRLVPGYVDFKWGWVAKLEGKQIPIGQASPLEIRNFLNNYEDYLLSGLPNTHVWQSPGMEVSAEVGSG